MYIFRCVCMVDVSHTNSRGAVVRCRGCIAVLPREQISDGEDERHGPVAAQIVNRVEKSHVRSCNNSMNEWYFGEMSSTSGKK